MRILVTGAAGFIGWNLTRVLRERHPGALIVGVDNLWTGRRREQEFVSKMYEMDVRHLGTKFPHHTHSFDYVYHLASPASPKHYQSLPLDTIETNFLGLLESLKFLEHGGTIFMASTSEVYGDPLVSPQRESYKGSVNCVGVRACYDESKRLCETYLTDHRRMHGTRVKIARLFNVYGPGTLEDDGRAVSNFVCRALRGEDLEVYGDGDQTRCFTYVDDVVEAIAHLVEDTGDFAGPINIGSDLDLSVQTIANIVRNVTRSESRIVNIAAVEDDPRQRLPELTLARRILGWNPLTLVPPTVGISRTADYFRAELGIK